MTPIVRRGRRAYDEIQVALFLRREHAVLNRRQEELWPLTERLVYRSALLLVAVEDGAVVGLIAIDRDTTSVRRDHVASIRIIVGEKYRANGLGSKLLRRALFWADRNGIARVVATPYLSNAGEDPLVDATRLGFFQKHGFVLEGTQRKAVYDTTVELYRDVALLARVV